MVLSLDASLTSTGYCVMEESNTNIIDIGKITTKAKKYITEENRIYYICEQVDEIIKKYNVKEVVVENQFLYKNAKTTMQLSRLRGALDYVILKNNCTLKHLQPSEIRKLIINNGSANKDDIASYISEIYQCDQKVVDLGKLCDRNCKDKNSDIYDAISIALAYKLLNS